VRVAGILPAKAPAEMRVNRSQGCLRSSLTVGETVRANGLIVKHSSTVILETNSAPHP